MDTTGSAQPISGEHPIAGRYLIRYLWLCRSIAPYAHSELSLLFILPESASGWLVPRKRRDADQIQFNLAAVSPAQGNNPSFHLLHGLYEPCKGKNPKLNTC